MSKFLILSPLSQFEVTSLIGINAPIFGHLNILLTNLQTTDLITFVFIM